MTTKPISMSPHYQVHTFIGGQKHTTFYNQEFHSPCLYQLQSRQQASNCKKIAPKKKKNSSICIEKTEGMNYDPALYDQINIHWQIIFQIKWLVQEQQDKNPLTQ